MKMQYSGIENFKFGMRGLMDVDLTLAFLQLIQISNFPW